MDAVIDFNERLRRIANHLLLNASFIDNIGLMHGKMGISIFFYHFARITQNKIYEEYAGELIDEIYQEINKSTPTDFENGLAGIGWGIEYLAQNKFIEADTDDVLEEFDARLKRELDCNPPESIGLLNGLVGFGTYFLKRVQDPTSTNEDTPTLTNKQTLIHLIDELSGKLLNDAIEKYLTGEISIRGKESYLYPSITTRKVRTNSPGKDSGDFELPRMQKLKPTTLKGPRVNTKEIFDITSDYPTLIWFLAELFEKAIFNSKVKKLIQRLLEPLVNTDNFPKLHSNRVLLAAAIKKIENCKAESRSLIGESSNPMEQKSLSGAKINKTKTSSSLATKVLVGNHPFDEINKGRLTLDTISRKLLTGITRETIKSELVPSNTATKYGASGLAWIYNQLLVTTQNRHFEKEMKYWINQSFSFDAARRYVVFNIENENNALGLLEGIAGIGFSYNVLVRSKDVTL
ncbi:MAG: hypothetical protein MI975_21765 [Cytophagales bacterium]|nr:hypothetical protein [Cytophagales bacterium]